MESPYNDRIVVVLNRTQDVVNIATSLRAMMNMGLTRLRLVAPDDFNAYRIAGIAHGSEPLIERIEFFDTLEDAVADSSLVVGTTARRRAATYVWNHPRAAAPELLAYDAAADRPVAIVFGREDTGLLNHELDRCDRLLVVPTSALNSSLNLSQAVLLIGYELFLAASAVSATADAADAADAGGEADRAAGSEAGSEAGSAAGSAVDPTGHVHYTAAPVADGRHAPLPRPKRDAAPATALELQALFEQTDAALAKLDFYKGKNPEAIMRTVRAIIRRADINEREAALLRAMSIEVQKALGTPIFRDAIMRRHDEA